MDIRGIAKLAGVSPSTVSKIVNQKDESISERTRERVLEIVRQYHYEPYSRTQGNRSWLIGVIFRSPVSFDSTLDGIVQVAQEQGYAPLVYSSGLNPEQEARNIDAAIRAGASGIIWEPVSMASLKNHRLSDRTPAKTITIGPNGGEQALLLPYKVASYKMTLELVKRGHTRIACLIREGRRTADFIDGFKRCLFDNGLAFEEAMVFTESSDALLDGIGNGEITGVACSHYYAARELSSLLEGLHYHAPEDVSIVSLRNDSGSGATSRSDSGVSTYTIRNADFGSFICEKLISRMQGKQEPTEYLQSFELDNEDSISRPPADRARRAVVVGSINIDTHLLVPQLPRGGMTISTKESVIGLGGKGANQAAGIVKLGQKATLIGNVGSDSASDFVFRELESNGIGTDGVYRRTDAETGRAFILVDREGDSTITVLSGANDTLSEQDVASRHLLFEGVEYCLVQTEVPMGAVAAACETARAHGAKTILKPVSCGPLDGDMLRNVDYLIPNESELEAICPEGSDMPERVRLLLGKGVGCVIVTLGKDGCLLCNEATQRSFPGTTFQSIDTAGASDAFISAFASSLMQGCDLESSVFRANFAAGYSTTHSGVIESLVNRQTLERVIARGA